MRIALVSDIHGNLTALRAVFAALDRHRPLQMIVAAGDHVLAGPRPAETWDALQAAGCLCLLGNEDVRLWDDEPDHTMPNSPWRPLQDVTVPWTVAALGPTRIKALQALPTSLRLIPASDAGLLVVHASIHSLTGWALKADTSGDDLARLYGGANARVICCGHYHAACAREWIGVTLCQCRERFAARRWRATRRIHDPRLGWCMAYRAIPRPLRRGRRGRRDGLRQHPKERAGLVATIAPLLRTGARRFFMRLSA